MIHALLVVSMFASPADWQPAPGPLLTRFAADVDPGRVRAEYPRPQLVRADWQNLNGLWDLAVLEAAAERPATFAERILVPFPIESALSGVGRRVGADEVVWYRRRFTIPRQWQGRNVLLNFEAADWETRVFVNGQAVGEHRGGFDPFSLDVTAALTWSGVEEVVVAVADPTDRGSQPRGKQVGQPHGIWYTPTSGIWGTVWLEPVPAARIDGLRIVPDLARSGFGVSVDRARVPAGYALAVRVLKGDTEVASARGAGADVFVPVPGARTWSPADPFLYSLRISLVKDETVVDEVGSYAGLREIAVARDEAGVNRLFLNGEPLFQLGPLDQGFWPDGLYTAPTDAALRYDLEVTKRLGFNMVRKHVKVEPRRWYFHCDRLGLLVWQDMPSGDAYIRPSDPDVARSEESARQFEAELGRVIDALFNHPSVVMWVPFNEGWGQYDTERICARIRRQDPTRLVNNASGWTDRGCGDVRDVHAYPGPAAAPVEAERAVVLGEFGGLGLPLPGHTWQAEKNWGYRSYESREELTDAYVNVLTRLRPLIAAGLSAAVYTQTTDVEIEVNGLMTYDRAVLKPDQARVREVNLRAYLPPPVIETVVGDARQGGAVWKYTTTAPADGWAEPGFDCAGWEEGTSGFGTTGTPGAIVGTEWSGPEIWIRREFFLAAIPAGLHLAIHHDEDAEVFLNGRPALALGGYTTGYEHVPLRAADAALLEQGANTIAVHCRQTAGGQYIDVGLVRVTEQEER